MNQLATAVLRPGRVDDAHALAELVDHAGEGLPLLLWRRMAEPGETPWDVGRTRAGRTTGAFSYLNATVVDRGGASMRAEVAGCLIGYGITEDPEPVPDDIPAMFRPLQELENHAPGSWYVNVLATYPRFRGLGYGTRLLGHAERHALGDGKRSMSIIVSDGNPGARRLYERVGYQFRASRPMVKEDWRNPGENWELLVKTL